MVAPATVLGDRSTSGFVIGTSRLRAVRARHPRARIVERMALTYRFGSGNVGVALETGLGGCQVVTPA